MIYCVLKGGLGNMLFQIAATINFAKQIGVECSFPNLSDHYKLLVRETKHNPNLKCVNHYRSFFQNLKNNKPPKGTPYIKFPFEFEKKILPNNCIIEGFFQSEKYFKSVRSEILEMFKTGDRKINKISVHIRRGDYLNNPNYHTVLSLEYYKKAIKMFDEKEFLIFSDDLEWCRENFTGKRFHFMDKGNDLQQMIIMSLCEHNIIANSSFSWWGAWLNKNEHKRVVAPKNWFGPFAKLETRDIYCDSWEIL